MTSGRLKCSKGSPNIHNLNKQQFSYSLTHNMKMSMTKQHKGRTVNIRLFIMKVSLYDCFS